LLLAKAVGDLQLSAVGNQSGGRVFLFLQTDDFWRDYDAMKVKGIVFAAPLGKKRMEPLRCFWVCMAISGI